MKKAKSLFPLGPIMVVGTMALGGCNGGFSDKRYTLYDVTSLSPNLWGPGHRLYTHDALVYSYTESGLVDFVPDESKTSYKVIPVMAKELPLDATSTLTDEEVSRYRMEVDTDKNGEKFTKGQKWLVKLNPNAVFEDGSKITADTYIESLKRVLDPQMQMPRASDFTTGKVAVAGGEFYLKNNRAFLEPYLDEKGQANKKQVAKDDGWFFNLYKPLPFFRDGISFFSMCKNYFPYDKEVMDLIADKDAFGDESHPKDVRIDSKENEALRDRVFLAAKKIVRRLDLADPTRFQNAIEERDIVRKGEPFSLEAFLFRYFKNPEYSFENVGIKKIDDYSFYYYFKLPLASFFAQQFFG